MFFFAAAFWTLVSSGLLGFLTGPPVALYYVQGLDIASVHDRIMLPGVCGMLAIGLLLFMIQTRTPTSVGHGLFLRLSFRSVNIAVCVWLVLILLPAGLAQLWASVEIGYWYARSAEFLHTNGMAALWSMPAF